MKRYYLLIGVALFITGMFSFLQSSDRLFSSIIFNTLALAIPISLFFLFIDYALTITDRHYYMRYFYVLTLLTNLSSLHYADFFPLIDVFRPIMLLVFGLATIIIVVSFFMYAFGARDDNQRKDIDHAMHIIADEYQKRKEKHQSWEEQIFEFFEEKLAIWKEKRKGPSA